ncbi:MAG: helix-hairpin-helix domain-containing protein, partial [Pseudomonadota bacterium]
MEYFASYFALVFILGAFIGFAFGYFYRGGVNARRAPRAEPTPAAAAPVAAASDELLGLPGMPPATAAALAGVGVGSLDDLRRLSGDRLAEVA